MKLSGKKLDYITLNQEDHGRLLCTSVVTAVKQVTIISFIYNKMCRKILIGDRGS